MDVNILYTHIDYDGIASAALFMHQFRAESLFFTTPKQIDYDPVGESDAVLDLPFPRRCAVWFDHHEQNFAAPALMGIDAESIPGLRKVAPSCARVILDSYQQKGIHFPDHFHDLADSLDRFDSMDFPTIEEWLAETPGKIVNDSLEVPGERNRERYAYFERLAWYLLQKPLAEVARIPEVAERYLRHRRAETDGLAIFRRLGRFLPGDPEQCMLILDFTGLKYPPFADKKLAMVDYPDVEYTMAIYPVFERDVKTNDISISVSRNFLKKGAPGGINLGEFFSQRDVGGGHPDAAGARLDSRTKAERDRKLDQTLSEILSEIQKAREAAGAAIRS